MELSPRWAPGVNGSSWAGSHTPMTGGFGFTSPFTCGQCDILRGGLSYVLADSVSISLNHPHHVQHLVGSQAAPHRPRSWRRFPMSVVWENCLTSWPGCSVTFVTHSLCGGPSLSLGTNFCKPPRTLASFLLSPWVLPFHTCFLIGNRCRYR